MYATNYNVSDLMFYQQCLVFLRLKVFFLLIFIKLLKIN